MPFCCCWAYFELWCMLICFDCYSVILKNPKKALPLTQTLLNWNTYKTCNKLSEVKEQLVFFSTTSGNLLNLKNSLKCTCFFSIFFSKQYVTCINAYNFTILCVDLLLIFVLNGVFKVAKGKLWIFLNIIGFKNMIHIWRWWLLE